jgi:DNA-binding transcriptional ArsR family regulator
VTLAELADALDLEARLVSHHVQVLVACGLIVLDGDGRARAT